MDLRLSGLLLALSLSLSSSALTPEECEPLVKPLSMADPSSMYGKFQIITGYNDNVVYQNILKITQSVWMELSKGPDSNKISLNQGNRINGTCTGIAANVTLDGDTARTNFVNVTSSLHTLPTCEGCLLLSINSSAISKLFDMIKIGGVTNEPKIEAYSVYLMAKDSVVKDSDLAHFRKQASCLGFDGEPNFTYDPKNTLCTEDEIIKFQA